MSVDISEAFDEMARTVASDLSIEAAMATLIDGCAKRCPDANWQSLREFDFDSDIAGLSAWLAETLKNQSPLNAIKAYWFGLYNPILQDGLASCCLYVSGSTRYSADDMDWAVWKDDSYLPDSRYARSHVLKDAYRFSETLQGDQCGLMAEYMLCLGYSALFLRDFFRSADLKLTLGESEERFVAVGFDEGDYIVLGKLDRSGWHPAPCPENIEE